MRSKIGNLAVVPCARSQAGERRGEPLLYLLFMLSGAAGLIYEVVWFQLLRLTIGANTQSLGLLLACFMGGLFLGSLLYGQMVPRTWHPLRVYACLELGIAICGMATPSIVAAVRGIYLTHADSPQAAMVLRAALCVVSLAPPTIFMGATLPALSRWVRADGMQVREISRLYAMNTLGAVLGVFGSALLLLPAVGLPGANWTAVGINVFVVLLALAMSRPYSHEATVKVAPRGAHGDLLPIYVAYALSGLAALGFQVLWSRLMSCVLGATVYGFSMVLGVFLAGLALGGAVGSAMAVRLPNPRRTFAILQLAVMGAVGGTSVLIPWVSLLLTESDIIYGGNLWLLSLTSLLRTIIVVLPGAFLWGMCFPVALSCTAPRLDAARPVGRLYALNTLGAVAGALLTGLVLIPKYRTATGAAHLALLPGLSILALYWPRWLPRWVLPGTTVLGVWALVGLEWPKWVCLAGQQISFLADSRLTYLCVALLPAFAGYQLFLVRRVPMLLAGGAAASGLLLALSSGVPAEVYALGRQLGATMLRGDWSGEIVRFEEGPMEPVVVYRSKQGPLQISVNGAMQASSVPCEMTHLRMLGHLPALLSEDPRQALVIGLGAGVSSGCLGIQNNVERVQVVELEPKVKLAAEEFKEANHWAMRNPKITVLIDDGRHFMGATRQRFGVITSDPIEPFWAGSAALYTVEYYQLCRQRLVEGGVFVQWLGVFGIDEASFRAMLKSFAEVFPEGGIWRTTNEILLISSTKPLRVDIEALEKRMSSPEIASSLAAVGISNVEDLLGHYVCSMASLREYLAGVVPNRDSNLLAQYRGWQAYYQFSRWRAQIKKTLTEKHEATPDIFVVPLARRAAFDAGVHRTWERVVSDAPEDAPVLHSEAAVLE